MRRLMEKIQRLREYAGEAQDIYGAVSADQEPTPFLVFFPLLYRRILNQEVIDPRVTTVIGQYLSTQYPKLTTYFLSEKHKEHVESMRKTLDEFFGAA